VLKLLKVKYEGNISRILKIESSRANEILSAVLPEGEEEAVRDEIELLRV